jgi:flagellin
MREVAVQAANDTNSSDDRVALQAEITQLTSEINRIAATTTWAGVYMLNGDGADGVISTTADQKNTFNFQISSNETGTNDTLAVGIKAIDATSLGIGGSSSTATVAFGTLTAADATSSASNTSSGVITLVGETDAAATSGTESFSFTVDGGSTLTFDFYTNGVAKGYDTTSATAVGQAFVQYLEDTLDTNTYSFSATAGAVTINKTNSISVSSTSNANSAMSNIDAAILELNTQRAQLGSFSNRLDSTVSNLTNISSNLQAGRGRIEDADFAAETTNLAKTQILQQASTAMLAQANAAKQNVLSLLQG